MSHRIILIVDDNEDSRIVFSIIMQRAGFLTILGRDGVEGLHLARAHLPDAVVADLHLPKLDGRELIVAMRANPRTASIPAILITADASAGAPLGAQPCENAEVVLKPCSPRELLEAIERCLGPDDPRPSAIPDANEADVGSDEDSPVHSSPGGLSCASR